MENSGLCATSKADSHYLHQLVIAHMQECGPKVDRFFTRRYKSCEMSKKKNSFGHCKAQIKHVCRIDGSTDFQLTICMANILQKWLVLGSKSRGMFWELDEMVESRKRYRGTDRLKIVYKRSQGLE